MGKVKEVFTECKIVECPKCGCENGNHAQECTIYYNAGYGKKYMKDSEKPPCYNPNKTKTRACKGDELSLHLGKCNECNLYEKNS